MDEGNQGRRREQSPTRCQLRYRPRTTKPLLTPPAEAVVTAATQKQEKHHDDQNCGHSFLQICFGERALSYIEAEPIGHQPRNLPTPRSRWTVGETELEFPLMPPRHLVWAIAACRLVSAAAGPASIIHCSARFSVRLSAVSPSRPAISQGVACGSRQAWPTAIAKRRAAGFTQAASNATLGQAGKLTTTHPQQRRPLLMMIARRPRSSEGPNRAVLRGWARRSVPRPPQPSAEVTQ